MNLIDYLDIRKKDIITIVGAGGKTSLMYSASSLLRKDYRVLVTTTTHIYIPASYSYDNIIMLTDYGNTDECKSILSNIRNGIYVVGNHIVDNVKIKGLNFEQIDEIIDYFDIIMIEGDGSKRKPLKGWNSTEPVIYPKTTKTIGVLNIKSLGLYINEDNIHRLDKFLKITNTSINDKVDINHLRNIVLSKNGLFKRYKGEKILFINKVENYKNKQDSINLIENIKSINTRYINKIVCGSIIKNEFFEE